MKMQVVRGCPDLGVSPVDLDVDVRSATAGPGWEVLVSGAPLPGETPRDLYSAALSQRWSRADAEARIRAGVARCLSCVKAQCSNTQKDVTWVDPDPKKDSSARRWSALARLAHCSINRAVVADVWHEETTVASDPGSSSDGEGGALPRKRTQLDIYVLVVLAGGQVLTRELAADLRAAGGYDVHLEGMLADPEERDAVLHSLHRKLRLLDWSNPAALSNVSTALKFVLQDRMKDRASRAGGPLARAWLKALILRQAKAAGLSDKAQDAVRRAIGQIADAAAVHYCARRRNAFCGKACRGTRRARLEPSFETVVGAVQSACRKPSPERKRLLSHVRADAYENVCRVGVLGADETTAAAEAMNYDKLIGEMAVVREAYVVLEDVLMALWRRAGQRTTIDKPPKPIPAPTGGRFRRYCRHEIDLARADGRLDDETAEKLEWNLASTDCDAGGLLPRAAVQAFLPGLDAALASVVGASPWNDRSRGLKWKWLHEGADGPKLERRTLTISMTDTQRNA